MATTTRTTKAAAKAPAKAAPRKATTKAVIDDEISDAEYLGGAGDEFDPDLEAVQPEEATPKVKITPEVVEKAKAKRVTMSHEDCDHPRTPKGRAACRAARKAAA